MAVMEHDVLRLDHDAGKTLWSVSRLSEEFDIDRRTVSKRITHVKPRGKVHGVKAWHLKEVASLLAPKIVFSSDQNPEDLTPDLKKAFYDAELKRLTYETKAKELVPKELYIDSLSNVYKTLVGTLDNIPDILERDCELDGHAVAVCQKVIDRLRDEIAATMNRLNDGE